MNNKNAYNPLQRAAAASWAELSTPEACQWYFDRAWADTLTTWAAIGNVCQATIHLGIFCRVLVQDWLSPEPEPIIHPLALQAGQIEAEPAACDEFVVVPEETTPNPPPVFLLAPAPDLKTLTNAQLTEIIKQQGIDPVEGTGRKRPTKAQLLALLQKTLVSDGPKFVG